MTKEGHKKKHHKRPIAALLPDLDSGNARLTATHYFFRQPVSQRAKGPQGPPFRVNDALVPFRRPPLPLDLASMHLQMDDFHSLPTYLPNLTYLGTLLLSYPDLFRGSVHLPTVPRIPRSTFPVFQHLYASVLFLFVSHFARSLSNGACS